ncbi:MAG: ComF family protein [Hyphomicrobiaceae bacterium]|nr:ComF family protein [Hyphomicrobiaceae bacterium]
MPNTPPRSLPRWLQLVADTIVPPVCLSCQARVVEGDALCGTCWRDIAFIRPPLCDRLGLPLPFGGEGPLISAAAAADPPAWTRARAVAVYEAGGVMARLVTGMKYHDRHDARRLFGRWLASAGGDLLIDAELLIPVPLTRWRLVRRQFNQSAILAAELSQISGIPWSPFILMKTRSTRPQVELTGAARRDNLRGAFEVPRPVRQRLSGRRVVLIDDVVTTGATAEACTRALIGGGAARVDVLTLGRAPTPASVSP